MNKDNFQSVNVGKIVKSTLFTGTRKQKNSAKLASLEIQFGFNLKQDAPKTKQLKLF